MKSDTSAAFQKDGANAWIFLNTQEPWCAWGTYRGVLLTPPTEPSSDRVRAISPWNTRLLKSPGSRFWGAEIGLERVRRQHFLHRTSRLTGIFYFLDTDSAKRAARLWNDTSTNRFSIENLTPVNVEVPSQNAPLDSNWITYYSQFNDDDQDWMMKYWTGESYPGEQPIWEAISGGRVIILDTEIRNKAYDTIKSTWPDSLMFLEMSRLAAWIGSDLGTIVAFLSDGGDEYKIQFYMNMLDANNPEFLDNIQDLIESGHPTNWPDMIPHIESGNFGNAPDMTKYEFSIPKSIPRARSIPNHGQS